MDSLLHYPLPYNPYYEAENDELRDLELRMERFAADAVLNERRAAMSEDEAMADAYSALAEGSWREFRRLKDELNDLEGGW